MGQYYRPCLEQEGVLTVFNRDVDGKYTVAKLTEHSWWNNSCLNAISEKIYQKQSRLIWCGDYAEEIKKRNGHAIDHEPCDEYKKYMEQGIMLCSVRDGESGNNPYRTGALCVLKEEAVKQFSTPEMFEQVKKTRFAFIEDSVWDQLGLPRGNSN